MFEKDGKDREKIIKRKFEHTNYLDRIEEIGDSGVYCLVGLGLAELKRRKMKDKITMYR